MTCDDIKISEFNRPYDYSNDIALLQLDSPVEFNEKLSPLCIPDENVCFKEGKILFQARFHGPKPVRPGQKG